MVRTRDFMLIFATIGFLVVAIGTTVFSGWQDSRVGFAAPSVPASAQIADDQITATLTERNLMSRTERLLAMRSKVAAIIDLPVTINEPVEEAETDELATTSSTVIVQRCTPFIQYANLWDARDLSVAKADGVITIQRTITEQQTGSTSVETVVQVPALTLPTGQQHCLYSDVIGLALDGSLIRNEEIGLYSIFGSNTLIGYSLDGFPIHGAGVDPVDICNGRVVSGQYRYELQPEQESIINCFGALPQYLP